MIENIKQIRERHEKEISELQKNCPHEHIQVQQFVYTHMFHDSNIEDYCEDCGKLLAYYKRPFKMVKKNNSFTQEYTGPEEKVDPEKLFDWMREHETWETSDTLLDNLKKL